MTIDDFVALLEARGCRPRRSGKGWVARCPAHEDRRPSLAAGSGDDGRILVKCFTGCPTEAICGALGLTLADLMPPKDDPRPSRARHGGNGKAKREKKPEVFPTARAAVHALERTLGKRSALWTYRDAQGQPAGVVVRWDTPQGKEIRPIARCNGGWRIGQMPEPRPLYRLPQLLAADPDTPVWTGEGEKVTDALVALGLLATASAGGAQAAAKTDWQPLKGRKVVIVPDCDEPGRRYAEEVARLVHAGGAKEIRILDLGLRFPDLPEGFDAADLAADPTAVGLAQGATAEEVRAMLEKLADEAGSWEPAESPDSDEPEFLPWVPYPTDALPSPLRGFVTEAASATVSDEAYVALAALAALAGAIGGTRVLEAKRGWRVPCVLWAALVGDSGTGKTPAQAIATQWTRERHRRLWAAYEAAKAEYEAAMEAFEAARRSKNADPIPKPEPPAPERCLTADVTIEAVAAILAGNPRGVLLARDELAGWLAGFDRYATTRGGDVAFWLGAYNAQSVIVDRKTSATISVDRPCVSIVGGIQPQTLRRCLGVECIENGLAARLLTAMPPRRPRKWSEASVSDAVLRRMERVFDRLFELEFSTDEAGNTRPRTMRLTSQAKGAYIEFYERHAERLSEAEGDTAASLAKLEETPLRLAMVLHLARWADGGTADPDHVDEVSMQAAITLTEWHVHESRRILAFLAGGAADDERQELVAWIEARGGAATVRDLTRGPRKFRSKPGEAEEALAALVKAGIGCWELSPENQKGGRSTRVFRLNPEWRRRHNLKKRPKNEGFVAVASVAGEPSPPVTPEPPNPMPPVGGGDTEAAATPAREGGDDGWEEIVL